MEIKKLLDGIDVISIKNVGNFDCENLSCNSKEENTNGVFFCLSGSKVDGHNYVVEAEMNGAKCLVVEKFVDSPLMQVLVNNTRKTMALMSAKFYAIDKSNMKFVGITGTNGKTTTSFMVKAYLTKLGKRVGLIGTQGIYFNNLMLPAKLTTPDPIELSKIISDMETNGIEYVVMEASAHAIALNKIDGIMYDVVALTNITQDHLDFFKNMNNYANSKSKLLSLNHAQKAIINIDDDYTNAIANITDCEKTTVSLYNEADINLEEYDCATSGTRATINVNGEMININTNAVGKYNLSNTMVAMAIVNGLGFDMQEVARVVNETNIVVPGRFNVLKTPTDYTVVIDFAHTPDGIQNVLKTARELTNSRIICVFGCGGDRDRDKRHIMGEIAQNYADWTIVTSDNPRSENPKLIINEITSNMHKNFEKITTRQDAIHKALSIAETGDIVLILGKGAENYQEINGVKYPYSDFDVVDGYFDNDQAKNLDYAE